MGQIYEGMFLIDNDVVRTDWRAAKSIVTDTLTKYGATIHTARRWDERRLAYPINGKERATYFLAYYELPTEDYAPLRRDMDLNDKVLRYLQLAVDQVPEDEAAKAAEEDDANYIVPEPPEDDEPDVEETPATEGEGEKAEGETEAKEGEEKPKAEGAPEEAAPAAAPESSTESSTEAPASKES